jgi:uridine kinase
MLIIGIAGGTGCGKTTVVNQLLTELPENEVGVISQDAYYKDNSHMSLEERNLINFDHPQSIDFDLLVSHIRALKNDRAVNQPIYSFNEHNRTSETLKITPKKVLIIEGILILTNPELRDLIDIKIFVHADSDERLIRRIKRDISERGRDLTEVMDRYQKTLKPMHEQFIEPMKEYADIIFPNNHHNLVAKDIVKTIISNYL